jgi:hypothetical protein
VKSLTMLKSFLISSGVLPFIIFATVLQPTSLGKIHPSIPEDIKRHFLGPVHAQNTHSNDLMSR